jgi:general transcription factor 3C polypeptide 1
MVVSLPGVSNYGQSRTVDVVLLPSVEVSPNIMTQIYERQRAFDILIRHESSNRFRNSKPKNIPTLSGVQRIPKTETVDKGKTLHDNGFISPKLVRSRMLHRFLWCYVSELSDKNTQMDEPDAVNKSLISGETVFSLLVATQSMPLELFLQVIGSANHIKGLSERCRRGMILADLPRMESESLLDLNASGRLAWLVDILRRLKVCDFMLHVNLWNFISMEIV